MALREFFVRHRIAPAVVAPAVLGLAAVVAASWALTSPSSTVDTELKASVTECHDMVSISVAGRNDTPREGSTLMLVDANGNPLPAALSGDHNSEWLNPVVNAPADDVDPGSYAAVYIAYPANMATYEDAVNAGVANTQQVMREIAQACPDTRFAIVGYSEGADVVRRVAMGIGHDEAGADGTYAVVDPTQVVGVVILADAGRSAGDGPFPGAEDPFANPDGFDQQYQNGNTPVPGQGALPGTSGDFGALNGKIASFCSDGDLTCAAPQNISLLQLVVNVGRQLDVDRLEREGLTPATGGDVAAVLGQIAMAAFADIAAQPNWMASDETFLEVLLRVSDPEYKPGETPREPARADAIAAEEMSPLAYLPQKLFNEVIGLLVTNQNTIPVILSDPYNLTLGPNHSGHHFDYWDDADPSAGKPLTSAEYAAAWLTHLAKQAQAGVPLNTTTKPAPAELAAAYEEVEATVAATTTGAPSTAAPSTAAPSATVPTTAAPTTTVAPTTTGAAPTTTGNSTAPTTNAPATTADPKTAAPTTTAAPVPTTDAAATQPSVPVAPTTTTPAPSGR
ncbi:cutinase family protein [Nocardia farcinica]|uniref:cutinase family protein n=1 Tax=Nocardia TaxID=1817 RepID=UPI000A3AE423|nr:MULTISPECIES: cutinase family protein [Nocardia]MBA4857002.1 cutinase family protein [Nocardia farcinica]MBC9815463.1 cutinase family protein [Nocardia farcinica]MBF6069093.1 cutinase family protein [Nocardia farcinica]MBF6142728.1 cutinase family protein [Nocardia farcinica]MBF6188204.1 cutinase family protein [Nocardia farcinica]